MNGEVEMEGCRGVLGVSWSIARMLLGGVVERMGRFVGRLSILGDLVSLLGAPWIF